MAPIAKTWQEFRESGLLWWVNRSLHLFGWAIVVETDDDVVAEVAYPARVDYRGFPRENEEQGFRRLTWYLLGNVDNLMDDLQDEPAQKSTNPPVDTGSLRRQVNAALDQLPKGVLEPCTCGHARHDHFGARLCTYCNCAGFVLETANAVVVTGDAGDAFDRFRDILTGKSDADPDAPTHAQAVADARDPEPLKQAIDAKIKSIDSALVARFAAPSEALRRASTCDYCSHSGSDDGNGFGTCEFMNVLTRRGEKAEGVRAWRKRIAADEDPGEACPEDDSIPF